MLIISQAMMPEILSPQCASLPVMMAYACLTSECCVTQWLTVKTEVMKLISVVSLQNQIQLNLCGVSLKSDRDEFLW